MEQHPIPQHLASFQFKLFGNLTTRQFVSLVLPMGLATLIFFSNVNVLIRFPLSLIIGLIGIFEALVPVGGRPFDKWLLAFFKAIFAPTQRIWIKETNLPEFLNIVIAPVAKTEVVPEQITRQSRDRMVAYLRSLPRENQTPLDAKESMAIAELNLNTRDAGEGRLPPPIIWPTAQAPSLQPSIVVGETEKAPAAWVKTTVDKTELEKEEELEKAMLVDSIVAEKPQEQKPAIAPKVSESAKPYVLPGIQDRLKPAHKPIGIYRPATTHLASEANFSLENIFSVKGPDNQIRLMRGVGKTRVRKLHFAPPENFDLSKLPIRGERRFEISDELAKRFHFDDESPDVVLPNTMQSNVASVPINITTKAQEASQALPKQAKTAVKAKTKKDSAPLPKVGEQPTEKDFSQFSLSNTKQVQEAQQVQQNAQIIPLTTTPNVVSGLVTDAAGVPIEGAVLVVRDGNGIPIRALKTNKLGQFLSATPLSNGIYTVEIESEHAAFAPSQINLDGQIVQPLALQGTNKPAN